MTTKALTHEQARRVYDRIGRLQDTQAFYEDPAVSDLIRAGRFETARAVFELGCGTGRLAERLLAGPLAADATYRGIDLAPKMVAIARRRLAPFGARADVRSTSGDLPFPDPDGAYDRWISTFVLDLLPDGEIDAVLAEARRLLRPGGLLCLASLSCGSGPLSRTLARLWTALHRVNPVWVGGCRPLELAARLPAGAWRVEHHARFAPFGVPLAVVVAGV